MQGVDTYASGRVYAVPDSVPQWLASWLAAREAVSSTLIALALLLAAEA